MDRTGFDTGTTFDAEMSITVTVRRNGTHRTDLDADAAVRAGIADFGKYFGNRFMAAVFLLRYHIGTIRYIAFDGNRRVILVGCHGIGSGLGEAACFIQVLTVRLAFG